MVDRSQLPPLGPDPAFAFPEIRRRILPNGLGAWTVEHHAVPLVSALVLIPAGAGADTPERPGLAALTGDLLDEGCGDFDALELHEALGRIGAQLETEVGADATLVAITTLKRFAPRGLALLADMVMRPRLESHEFERVRDLRLNRLVQLRDLPPAIAERAFVEVLYDAHPYGHLPIGTEVALRALSAQEVKEFHQRVYVPSRTTIIAVGDSTHAQLAELIEDAFGGWAAAAPSSEYPDPTVFPVLHRSSDVRLTIVDRPGAAQSELRIGHVTVPRTTPDYHALMVLNMVLGGQFVSRINMNLREEKGLTYGARTSFEFRRGPGPFVLQASVQSDATAAAIRESLRELSEIRGERPVTRAELQLGRAALTRGYPRSFETADQVARAAAQLALYQLPDDYFTTFVPRVLLLDESQITDAAARHIHPERLSIVVVGDRDKIGELAAER